MNLRIFLIAIVLMLGSTQAWAQSTAFTYQGKLNDGGTPANGNYDLTVQLFDTADTGTGTAQAETLKLVGVPVSAGMFTVELDFGDCGRCFNGERRFLEIAVRPSGGGSFTTLSPRQPISSIPYAQRSLSSATTDLAIDAQRLGGVTATEYLRGSDPRLTDARTPTPGSANYIQNTTSQQAGSSFNISGNGTAAGTLSGNVLNAATRYDLAGERLLEAQSAKLNTFLGFGAGASNTTGERNTSFGNGAGRLAATGNLNSFFGALAGEKTTGTGNSFFGAEAGLFNTTGYQNVFVGDDAGLANTTGHNNVAVGDIAGSSNQTGSENTLIGSAADSLPGLNNATAIGANAMVTRSDALVLGSINGVNGSNRDTNVGIGTTNPLYRLDVNGHAHFNGNTLANTVVALDAFNLNADRILFYSGNALNVGGGHGVLMGSAFDQGYQLEAVSQGNKGARFGTLTGGGTVLSVGGAGDVQVDANGTVGGRFIIKEGGNVGIGQNNPTAKLEVGGNIKFTGLGTGGATQLCRNVAGEISQCSSSRRYKTDVRPFTGSLNLINLLQPVTFKWKADKSPDLGFVAEDVAAIEPLLVTHNSSGEIEGVKYDRLNVVLVNAIKEQQAQIKSQEEKISSQEAKIKSQSEAFVALQTRMASLEQAMRQQSRPRHRR